LRIEIAFAHAFSGSTVEDIDHALSHLGFMDALCRNAMYHGVQQDHPSAKALYETWSRVKPLGWETSAQEFATHLELTDLYLMPDGGFEIPDRLRCTYTLKEGANHGAVTVRLLEPDGPRL